MLLLVRLELGKLLSAHRRFLLFGVLVVVGSALLFGTITTDKVREVSTSYATAAWRSDLSRSAATDQATLDGLRSPAALGASAEVQQDIARRRSRVVLDTAALASGGAPVWANPMAFMLLGSFLPGTGFVILLLAARLAGALVAGERSAGTLALALAGPVTRGRFLRARLAAMLLVVTALLALGVAVAMASAALSGHGAGLLDPVWTPISASPGATGPVGVTMPMFALAIVAVAAWCGGALLMIGLGAAMSVRSGGSATPTTVVSVAVVLSLVVGLPLTQMLPAGAALTAVMVSQPVVGLNAAAEHWQSGFGLLPSVISGAVALVLGSALLLAAARRFGRLDVA